MIDSEQLERGDMVEHHLFGECRVDNPSDPNGFAVIHILRDGRTVRVKRSVLEKFLDADMPAVEAGRKVGRMLDRVGAQEGLARHSAPGYASGSESS